MWTLERVVLGPQPSLDTGTQTAMTTCVTLGAARTLLVLEVLTFLTKPAVEAIRSCCHLWVCRSAAAAAVDPYILDVSYGTFFDHLYNIRVH